jgi:hypothetical protein
LERKIEKKQYNGEEERLKESKEVLLERKIN